MGGAESKRGAAVVAHSRVCGAADKGPSLDNYLPFARLPSVILGLETEEERGGGGRWGGGGGLGWRYFVHCPVISFLRFSLSLLPLPPLLAFLAELRTGTAKLNERRKDRFDVGAARAQVIYFPRMRRATTGGMFFDYVRWTC